MNRKILILLFIILHLTFYIGLKAQDTWIYNYQPFGEDVSYFVEDIRVCPDEGYAVIGSIWDEWEGNRGYMMKTDSDGNLQWASIDTVDFIGNPEPSGFVVLDDGSFITVGNDLGFGNSYLLKRNADGIIQWVEELDAGYRTEAIELTDEGHLITTGGATMEDPINLQKFDLDGNLIWRQTYLPDGFEYGQGNSVIQTSDDGFALTGYFYGSNNKDIIVIKTDSMGDSLWSWTYNGTANLIDQASCIIENLGSELIIGGYINDLFEREYFGYLIKMNAIGDTIWTTKVDGVTGISSIFQTQDNNYILRGGNNITKLNNEQEIIWQVPRLVDSNAQGDRTIFEQATQHIVYVGRQSWGNSITIVKCDAQGEVTEINNTTIIPLDKNLMCYPNPFNPIINFEVKLTIEHTEGTAIQIFNLKGQKVDELSFNNQHTSISWNAENQASGIYFCKLVDKKTGETLVTRKITLLK